MPSWNPINDPEVCRWLVRRELRSAKRLKLGPRSLEWVCEQLGVERGRGGRYSKTAYRLYTLIGRALQALKRAKTVRFASKRKGGPGWELA
jgi:hypothetical protein